MPVRKLSIGVALALLGCTHLPAQWAKTGATPDQTKLDLAECNRAAWAEAELPAPAGATRPAGAPAVVVGPTGIPSVVYLPPTGDLLEGWQELQRRYAESCMRAKGYELRRVER